MREGVKRKNMQYTHITIKIFSMSFIIIVIYCYIKYICQVGVKTKVRVMGVKRILIWIRRCRYAMEDIFTSANMIIIEFDK